MSAHAGARIPSVDGGLTVGMRPDFVPGNPNVFVQIERRQFPGGDPRASRNGRPLAYTYELSATLDIGGPPVERFSQDAVLMFNTDPSALAAAGVRGIPHVYTYNEQQQTWEEVLSRWDPEAGKLVAATPHFSLYAVGDGFDKVNNYLPSVNSFEVDLQSGTASIQYPFNIPPGPAGFGPKVSLSYNSGNVDRVDVGQQGSSPVGWGWNLSMNSIAATQHHWRGCINSQDPSVAGYHPWTVSISVDGVNGDLIKDNQYGTWHTTEESFARIEYDEPGDTWTVYGKDGTQYYFEAKALTPDDYNKSAGLCNGDPVLRTYKWMLTRAIDIFGNQVTYGYWFERADNGQLSSAPVTGVATRAVYPRQIDWGPATDKLRVLFDVVPRAINGVDDIEQSDINSGTYQQYRVSRVSVYRRQQSTNSLSLLRAYDLQQTYMTLRASTDPNAPQYSHLRLDAIVPRGNDGTTSLPGTSFSYWAGTESYGSFWDQGHLFWATNGYGGQVGYYYDAAGSDVHSAYRRVRARKVQDGLGADPPHSVSYLYDYRGADTNHRDLSAEVSLPQPNHTEFSQFRGFAWVRVQDPANQVTDHYYSQDDTYKAKEWRVQVGKTITYTTAMNGPAPTVSVTPDAEWSVTNQVQGYTDPLNGANNVWRALTGSSVQRAKVVGDGADVAMRFYLRGASGAQDSGFQTTWKLSADASNYWGIKIYRAQESPGVYASYAKLIWSVGGQSGERDLSPTSPVLPSQKRGLFPNTWYWIQLHTSPDGRFVAELYADDYITNPNDGNRRTNLYGDHLMVKGGDPRDAVGNTIPLMPGWRQWTFRYDHVAGNGDFTVLLDDYSETRTVYSQSDTFYSRLTHSSYAPKPFAWQILPGRENNTDGMDIRFVVADNNWTTAYGAPPDELHTYKRNRVESRYDAQYGYQTASFDYGDVGVTGDERSTHMAYVNNTSAWIIGKLRYTKTYQTYTEDVGGVNLLAHSINYYDGSSVETATPTQGKLTWAKQCDVTVASCAAFVLQRFTYDSYGNQTTVYDPNNNPTTTAFDTYYHSFPETVTLANNTQQTTHYDFTLDAVDYTTDPNGKTTMFRYDKFGRPTKSWVTGYGSETDPNEIYTFNDLNQTSVTPPFYIKYSVKTADGLPPTYSWGIRWFDGRGRTVQDVTPKDATHTIMVDTFYNAAGQVERASLPYSIANNNPAVYVPADTSKPRVTRAYDGLGRVTGVTNPDDTSVLYDYSLLRWVAETDETRAHNKWTHTDGLGRTDQVFLWDMTGQDPAAPSVNVTYGYDALDRLRQVVRDPGGANQTTATMDYDGLGRKSYMLDPDMGRWDYGYDNAGNMLEQFDPLCPRTGTCTDPTHHLYFDYDNMNRITKKYYGWAHKSAGIPDVRYYYDNDLGDAATAKSWNKLRHAEVTLQGQGSSKANGHAYKYDVRGLLVWEAVTTTLTTRAYETTYGYDVAGRSTTLTYPDPETPHEQVTTTYNTQALGLPSTLLSNLDNGARPIFSSQYNDRGQLTQIVQGTSPTQNGLTTNFGYDDTTTKRGWLKQITASTNSTEVLNLTMGYYPNGNISQVQQTSSGTNNPSFTNTYTYDAFDRLKTASSVCGSCSGGKLFVYEEYQFDSLSRMSQRKLDQTWYSVAYNDPAHKDAPTGYNGATYGYDALGNQTSRTSSAGTQTRAFDPEGRITQVISGTYTTGFVYDANGARIIKSVTDSSSKEGPVTTRTLYIGGIYEETITNQPSPPYISYYTFGGKLVGMRRANQVQSSTNGQQRIVSDHLGSTTLVVDTSNPPQVLQRQYHKPYGETAWQYAAPITGGASLTNVAYTGQRSDEDSTGLMFYNARMYDPVLSTFVAADTVGPYIARPGSFNRYGYVLNNPLRYTDPTGHDADESERAFLRELDEMLTDLEGELADQSSSLEDAVRQFSGELEDDEWVRWNDPNFPKAGQIIKHAEKYDMLMRKLEDAYYRLYYKNARLYARTLSRILEAMARLDLYMDGNRNPSPRELDARKNLIRSELKRWKDEGRKDPPFRGSYSEDGRTYHPGSRIWRLRGRTVHYPEDVRYAGEPPRGTEPAPPPGTAPNPCVPGAVIVSVGASNCGGGAVPILPLPGGGPITVPAPGIPFAPVPVVP
jgi:RHS repeat-associated protein